MFKKLILIFSILPILAGCSGFMNTYLTDGDGTTAFPYVLNGVAYDLVGSEVQVIRDDTVTTTGNVSVESEIGGYPVTSLGSSAFYGSGLTSITIPTSVTSIANYAFSNCSSLASITLPDTITSIGDEAFSYSGLTSITWPSGTTTVPYQALYDCDSLTTVVLPATVTSIGDEAFGLCELLDTINIPSGLTSLGNLVFQANSFTSITLPAGITTVPSGTFTNCTSLTSVTMEGVITAIGFSSFADCTSLADLYLNNSAAPTVADSSGGAPDSFLNVPGTLNVHTNTGASGFGAVPWSGFTVSYDYNP
ncbi:MAG: leucine-rich repeat domain-containing protein [Spirochaetales bacterium]|nr:leucine-rich repeat domain-containing protein [Spirochaetales bacterium]